MTPTPPAEDRLNEATEHLYQCAVTNFRLDVFVRPPAQSVARREGLLG